MKHILKRITAITCLVVLLLSLIGCSKKTTETNNQDNATQNEESSEKIVLKFFSNLPDRNTGLGKLEQLILDQYMEENSNVEIQLETLQDEAYKQKFTAYVTSNDLPDLFHVWGLPSFINPVMEHGYAAELNLADYNDYNFVPGSLDGFTYEGKLYGIPKIMDFMVMYYNKGIFDKNNIEVPKSFEDISDMAKAFRDNSISTISMAGKDGWPLGILFQELLLKQSGNQKLIYDILDGKISVKDTPDFLKAAELLQKLAKDKVFQESSLTADYGASINLFGQEKAAMYYMGSWEVGLSQNESFSENFRENVAIMPVPVSEEGEGDSSNLLAWYGGGYSVSANSKQKNEAIRLLNYMMKPENWAKNAWQLGVCTPAQDFSDYFTGNETELQKQAVDILNNATDTSGVVWIDYLTPAFKTDAMNATQELVADLISPEEFIDKVDKALQDLGN